MAVSNELALHFRRCRGPRASSRPAAPRHRRRSTSSRTSSTPRSPSGRGTTSPPRKSSAVVPGPRAARGGRGGRRRDVRRGALRCASSSGTRAPEHAGRDSRRAGALHARPAGGRDRSARPARPRTEASSSAPAVRGAGTRSSTVLARVLEAQTSGNLGPAEGMPQGHLRLALLRRVAKRVVDVVLDVDLRKPLEDRRLQAPEARAVTSALVRRRSGLAPPAPTGQRRRRHGARARRSRPPSSRGCSRASPSRRTARPRRRSSASRRRSARFGPCGSVSRRARASASACSTARSARAFSGIGLPRPRPAASLSREHGRRQFRRNHRGRRGRAAGRAAVGTPAAPVHAGAVRGAPAPWVAVRSRTRPVCGSSRSEPRRCARRQLFGDFLRPTDAATLDATRAPALQRSGRYHRPPPPPLVLAEGRTALERAAPLARTYRTYAWVWPLAAGQPRLWDIDDLVRRSERARVELTDRSSSFAIDAPVEELRAAQQSANVAGRRLLLVGGEGAALLLAFTVLAARGMRRDLDEARRRLVWFGARRWQLWLLSGIESAGVAVVGVLVGWLVGILAAPSPLGSPELPSRTCCARASSRRAGSRSCSSPRCSPQPWSGSRCRYLREPRASAGWTSSRSRRCS